MYYKTIIKGKFDFGKAKTFEKIHKMATHKVENLYREAVCLDIEEAFDEETFTFTIPRTVYNITEKYWKNTVNLLEYLSQFAVVGRFYIWVIQDGQLILKKELEPNSEKNIVQYYLKGNRWMDEGNTEKAIESYNKAIAKYANHSMAYEKRGTINYQLKNYADAIYDFNKSIKLYSQNGTAYFGLALALLKTDALEEAEKALEQNRQFRFESTTLYFY
jgi:tetratricopeptide (TPR) repeat protein